MKVLLLAAGYGTRLQRELSESPLPAHQRLVGVPKPLLPVGGHVLLTHWMKILITASDIDDIYVVVNESNYTDFLKWSKCWPMVKLLSDGSTCNEDRIGAVGSIQTITGHFNIQQDLIVIAGDTLFYNDFDLDNVIQKFDDIQKQEPESSLVLYVQCASENVHRHGILETDKDGRVRGFLEKPQPSETTSRKACPCFYILSKGSLLQLPVFLAEKKDEPLKNRDATGLFINFLYQRMPVYALEISGRFDVGGLESYISCDEFFKRHS